MFLNENGRNRVNKISKWVITGDKRIFQSKTIKSSLATKHNYG